MKKTVLSILVISLLLGMVSCKKEGVYNPKQKISRVYYTYNYNSSYGSGGTSKYLREVWTWNDNLLTKIDYYTSGGNLSYTENYTYDGKQLSRVDVYSEQLYFILTYNGSKISQLDLYSEGSLTATYSIEHDGKHVSKMTGSYIGDKKSATPMRLPKAIDIFPTEQASKAFEELIEKIDVASKSEIVVEFTWDGNNVKSCTWRYGGDIETYTYEYDKYKNPFYGLFDFLYFSDFDEVSYPQSENNVTLERVTVGDRTEVCTYTYQYNKKNFPTQKIYTYKYDDYSSTSIYEYEYVN